MFDKLVQFLIDILYLFKFWYVIEPYEQGYTFHLGAPGRPIGCKDGWFGSGLHLIWPLSITNTRYYDITEDTADLVAVDLTTKDGRAVKVGGMFRYKVRADKAWEFIVLLGDVSAVEGKAAADLLSAAIAETVSNTTHADLFAPGTAIEELVIDEARKYLNRYGYKILDFHWNYKVTPSRVIRVLTD